MAETIMAARELAERWIDRTVNFGRSRRARKIGVIVVVVIVVYGLLGYFGVPMLVRHIATGSVAKSLERPVSMGDVSFNPYTLNLNIYKLHIGERDGPQPFADIARLHVKVSWSSLFHLAPIISELTVDQPVIEIDRIDKQRFNFSDLIESKQPAKPPGKRTLFSVSNIRVNDGTIHFNDQVLGQHHTVAHIQIGVPFIANLPYAVNIYVQPLLHMVVDGSPLRITGKAKPFSTPPESVLDVNLHRLDLSRYAPYLPSTLSIKLPQGALSCRLQVHFVNASPEPLIRVVGEIALEQIYLRNGANAPLLSLQHASAVLNDVQPLQDVMAFGAIHIDGLTTYVVRNPNGAINLASLTNSGGRAPASGPQQAAVGTPKATRPATTAVTPQPRATPHPVPTPGAKLSHQAAAARPTAKTPQSASTPKASGTNRAIGTAKAAANQATATSPAPPAGTRLRNLAAAAPGATPTATPAATSAAGASRPDAASTATNLSVQSLTLDNSTVNVADNSGATPAKLTLKDIHASIKNLHTIGPNPATLDMGANLGGGGSIAVKGTFSLAQSEVTTEITLDQVDLPALQAFAQSLLTADIASGKLTVHANVRTNFASNHFNVHVEPANVVLDHVQVHAPGGGENPISWSRLSTRIGQVDLAKHLATVDEVHADGLHLFVRREHNGELSLASLMRGATPPAPQPAAVATAQKPDRGARTNAQRKRARAVRAAASRRRSNGENTATRATPRSTGKTKAAPPGPSVTAAPPQSWHFRIASVVLANNDIHFIDDTMPKPVDLAIAPLNLQVTDVSSDFSKPFTLTADGVVNRKGSFKLTGKAALKPLMADLHVNTRRLDLALANPYVASYLNATITRALLTTNGALGVADEHHHLRVSYRGDATLGNVRVLDKVTSENFVRWNAFSARRIDFELGRGKPRVHIGGLSLADFYARVILNANGRVNLSDVMGSPQAPPTSVTRANTGVPPQRAATPSPTRSTTSTAKPGEAIGADIDIGGITLQGGRVNYTDNFIKPNYSADLTDVTGKIGTFGTGSTTPADVQVQAKVNGSAPVDISGSVNPLAPMAFVDIKAKADGVELTGLTPYSSKYTGYPITKGTLTVNIHYLLDQQKLTADNKIFIDQLTFGQKVESPSALNLPIRLAVALLKDSKGQIHLDIPVSGSLSDPQFSIAGAILGVLKNLIVKAATAPFKLLASAVGGIGGNEQLDYVEFPPGYATLTAAAQKKLDTLAKALKDRPALRLNISGRVDPAYDRDGLRDAKLQNLIERQKASDMGTQGNAHVQVNAGEYDKYLKQVYKAAKFDKPRNFLGLDKSLPPNEMKKLLLANLKMTDKDLHQLADARANAVRQWLSKQINPERLFVTAIKLNAEGIKDKGKTTRVDLSLD